MAGERSRAALLAPLCAAGLFGACADEGADGRDLDYDAVPAAERYGGTAVVLHAQDFQALNPLIADIRPNLQLHQFALYTPLLRYDADLNPQPGLAERWDTVRVTPDTLELTFHLRRDVRWHDGVPTTADDVAFTFERMKDPQTASPHANRYALYSPVVERIDSFTIRLRVRASPDFLVAWMTLPPAPRHLLHDVAPESLRDAPFGHRPVGNGPFRFVRRLPGREWVFDANDDYPADLGGRPYLDRVVFRIIPDATSRLTEVLAGSGDVSAVSFPHAAEVRTRRDVRLFEFSDGTWNYISWNLRLPLFQDARVRRALTMALDRREIASVVTSGHAQPGRSTVTPVHWAYDADDPTLSLPHDVQRALDLLEEAGWHDRDGDGIREDASGRPFRFTLKFAAGYDDYRESAVITQAQLRRVGVDVRLQQVELNTLISQVDGRPNRRGERERDFEAVVFGWVDGAFHKDDSPYLHSRAVNEPYGQAGFSNSRADQLMDSLRVTLDREAARPLWREYQQLLADEAPYVVLYYPDVLMVVRDRLRGVVMDRRGFLATLPRWWINAPDR